MTDFSFRDRVVSVLVESGHPDDAVCLIEFRSVMELQPGSKFLAYTNYLKVFLDVNVGE